MLEKILSNNTLKDRVFKLIEDGIRTNNDWEEPIRLLDIVEIFQHDSIMLIINYFLDKDENVFDILPFDFLEKNYTYEGIHYILENSGWLNKYIKNPEIVNHNFSDVEYSGDKKILSVKNLENFFILFSGEQQDFVYDVLLSNDIISYINTLNESTLLEEIIDKMDNKSINNLINYIYTYFNVVINNENELFEIIRDNKIPKLNLELENTMMEARASVTLLEYQDIIRDKIEKLFKNKIIYNMSRWEIDITNVFYEFINQNIRIDGLNSNYYKDYISLVKNVLDEDYENLEIPSSKYFEPNDRLVMEFFNENILYFF